LFQPPDGEPQPPCGGEFQTAGSAWVAGASDGELGPLGSCWVDPPAGGPLGNWWVDPPAGGSSGLLQGERQVWSCSGYPVTGRSSMARPSGVGL
jgi:hypothetical protein